MPHRLISVFVSVFVLDTLAIPSVASLPIRWKSASASAPTKCYSNILRRSFASCLRFRELTSSQAMSSMEFARRCGCDGFTQLDDQAILLAIIRKATRMRRAQPLTNTSLSFKDGRNTEHARI